MRSQDMFEKEKDIIKKRKAIIAAEKGDTTKGRIVLLKNRYGISSYYVAFQYDPRYDLFVPDYEFEAVDESQTPFANDGKENPHATLWK